MDSSRPKSQRLSLGSIENGSVNGDNLGDMASTTNVDDEDDVVGRVSTLSMSHERCESSAFNELYIKKQEIKMEGNLDKMPMDDGKRTLTAQWKKRYFVLRMDRLYYYKNEAEKEKANPLGYVEFSKDTTVCSCSTSKYSFDVQVPKSRQGKTITARLTLNASSEEDKKNWMEAMEELIHLHKQKDEWENGKWKKRYLGTPFKNSITQLEAVRLWQPLYMTLFNSHLSGEDIKVVSEGRYEGHSERITCLDWSPDGDQIVSSGKEHQLQLWQPSDPKKKCSLISVGNGWPKSCCFSPSGRMIACGGTENIVKAGNVVRMSLNVEKIPDVGRHEGDITSLAFLSLGSKQDSDLVSGSGDATCAVWDLEKSSFKCSFKHHTADVLTVGTEKDAHRVLSGSADTTTRLWDIRDAKTDGTIFTGAQSDVKSVCFSPHSTMCAVASADGLVRVYDIRKASSSKPDSSSDGEDDPALVYDTDQKNKEKC